MAKGFGATVTYRESFKIVVRRWICAVVVCGLVPHVVHAQSTSPKSFYKKDYAIAPGAEGRDEVPPPQDAPQRKGKGSSREGGGTQGSQGATTSVVKKRQIVVSVYVNSADKEHLAKVLEEVYALNDGKTVFVTSINHIGDYRTITPEIESELLQRKIPLYAVTEPPCNAQVTVSPAWIIQTKKGVHIAEGVIPIHSYFDEFGEFNPKQRNESVQTPSVEGF
jgi:hypothetical protein